MCAAVLAVGCLISACGLTRDVDRKDLAKNTDLYAFTGVKSVLPGDRPVFIAPVDRAEATPLPASDGAWPIQYLPDSIWERSPEVMVYEVLREEIARSNIFTGVQDTVTRDAVVIRPQIVAFSAGYKEEVEGSRSLASFTLRLEVLGPDTGNGDRVTVVDHMFPSAQGSPISLKPPEAHKLLAMAVRSSMAKALQELDASNVGRKGMPLRPLGDGD